LAIWPAWTAWEEWTTSPSEYNKVRKGAGRLCRRGSFFYKQGINNIYRQLQLDAGNNFLFMSYLHSH